MGKSTFTKNFLSILNYKIIIYFLSMISSIYFARILGPEGKGIFAIITSIIGIGVQFENVGIYTANTYYISKNIKNVEKCYGNSIILAMMCFIINVGLIFIMKYVLQINSIRYEYIAVAIFLITINLFVLMQKNFMIALGAVKKYNCLEIFDSNTCFTLVLLVSLFMPVDISTVVASLFLAHICVMILGIILTSKLHITPHISMHFFKESLPYGVKNYIASLMAYLALRIDVFMIKYFMGDYEVGLYSLAANLGELFFMVSSSISLLLFPYLSTLDNPKEKIYYLKKICRWMILISGGAIVLYIICAGFVVKILYGSQYVGAIPALRIILPGIFFWSVSQYFYSFFASENYIKPTIYAPTVGCIINILLNLFLIPQYGIIGSAIATTISYGVCLGIILCAFILYSRNFRGD